MAGLDPAIHVLAITRLEVTLPWLLAKFAAAAQRVIGQKGVMMLEKK